MVSSIQDYAKKINSAITVVDCVSFLLTAILLLCGSWYFYTQHLKSRMPVTYSVGIDTHQDPNGEKVSISRPFSSLHGKTYTFSWCKGVRIKEANKIFFNDEAEAVASGRRLSKLCVK